MREIFVVTFPFFALVLAGYVATMRRLLPVEAIPGLNTFVLMFALPCMLYRFASGTPITALLDFTVGLTYLVCALVVVALALALALRSGRGWNDGAFGALVAAFPNSGFMGVPLLVALLGPKAAGPAIVALAVDMVITSSVCIALSRVAGAGDHGARQAVLQALRGMASNPLPWAIGLGALASAAQWQLPAVVLRPVEMLADAASPAALFTLGAVLARSRLISRAASPAHLADAAADRGRDVATLVAIKILLHPMLVLAVGEAAIALGAPLDRLALVVLVLTAALPSASNVPILAERFRADAGRIAQVVLASTVVAFVSFPLAVAWLR